MYMTTDGMKTTVMVIPYKQSTIDKNTYMQTGEPITVKSVDGYEENLVEIITNDGSVIVRGDQLILAVKKCNFG